MTSRYAWSSAFSQLHEQMKSSLLRSIDGVAIVHRGINLTILLLNEQKRDLVFSFWSRVNNI